MLLTVLIVLAVVALFGGGYGHTRGWGYYGWSPFGLVLLILLVLFLTGNVHAQEVAAFAPVTVSIPDGANALVCQPATLGQALP